MGKSIQSFGQMEGLLGPDRLSEALRGRVREVILKLAEAELAEVLAAQPYERNGERRGYRHGKRESWRRNGKVDSSSVISGVLGRSIVRFWGVTSVERTGGGLGEPCLRFCVV